MVRDPEPENGMHSTSVVTNIQATVVQGWDVTHELPVMKLQ